MVTMWFKYCTSIKIMLILSFIYLYQYFLLFIKIIIKWLSEILCIAVHYTFALITQTLNIIYLSNVINIFIMKPLVEMTPLHPKTPNISRCKTFLGVKPTYLLRNKWLRTQWYNLFCTYSKIWKIPIFLFHFSPKWRIIFLTFHA